MATRYVVLAVVADDAMGMNEVITHAATCHARGDADHLASLIEDAAVFEVGDEEWVNPLFAEIAQVES